MVPCPHVESSSDDAWSDGSIKGVEVMHITRRRAMKEKRAQNIARWFSPRDDLFPIPKSRKDRNETGEVCAQPQLSALHPRA
eukprot:29594-Eustigmatos_ZCMA.PRE.1